MPTILRIISLCGDTIYSGKSYKRIMRGTASVNAPFAGWTPSKPYPQPTSYVFYGFYSQDSTSKRTYLRLLSWSNDSLLMDYNLQVGDTVKRGLYLHTQCPTPNPSPVRVIATDSLMISGHKFRILYTDSTGGWYFGQYTPGYFLIEGLGHINGIFEYGMAQEYYCHPFENCAGVDTVQFNVGALTVKKIEARNDLKIFPVPVSDKLSLNSPVGGSVCIYNSIGENVLRTKVERQQNEIDVRNLQPGIYFVELLLGEKRFSSKFVKE